MAYPEFLQRLLYHEEGLDALRPSGSVSADLLEKIRGATADDLASGSLARTETLRGALFYFCGSLDEAHRVVQAANGDLAAYLHGMIHRREGDFENARYWFSRAGNLPFFSELHRSAGECSEDVARQPNWDPFLFCTLCERREHGSVFPVKTLIKIQNAEFAVFLDYTFRAG